MKSDEKKIKKKMQDIQQNIKITFNFLNLLLFRDNNILTNNELNILYVLLASVLTDAAVNKVNKNIVHNNGHLLT